MRSNLLILAVLCLSGSARAADGGPAVAAKDAKTPPAALDAGPAVDVSQELNKTMGAMQAAQSAMAQAHATLEAEFRQWLAAKGPDAGTDKKLGKLKAAEEALITRHAGIVKKHAELVAKVETLARDHADKKTNDKKATASQGRLVKDQQKLTADHQALLAEHTKRIGAQPAADGGLVDAGVAGGPADAGSTDAGSSDAGSLDAGAAAGLDAAVADAGLAAATPVDAGAPAAPPKSDSCSAAGGALGWTLISALALLRRSRRRSV